MADYRYIIMAKMGNDKCLRLCARDRMELIEQIENVKPLLRWKEFVTILYSKIDDSYIVGVM